MGHSSKIFCIKDFLNGFISIGSDSKIKIWGYSSLAQILPGPVYDIDLNGCEAYCINSDHFLSKIVYMTSREIKEISFDDGTDALSYPIYRPQGLIIGIKFLPNGFIYIDGSGEIVEYSSKTNSLEKIRKTESEIFGWCTYNSTSILLVLFANDQYVLKIYDYTKSLFIDKELVEYSFCPSAINIDELYKYLVVASTSLYVYEISGRYKLISLVNNWCNL